MLVDRQYARKDEGTNDMLRSHEHVEHWVDLAHECRAHIAARELTR